ncbi:MAG: ComEC/Rec2 family competence protein [Clostridium sp.]
MFKIFKKIIIIFLIIYSVLKIFSIVFNLKRNTISFVDIGQGDSSVITTKDNMNIVIDCGEGESPRYPAGKKILYPYLLKKGITKIDYLMLSHFDSDHSGGAKNIIEKLEVKNLIIGRQLKMSKQYNNIIESAKKKNVKIIYVKKGDKFKIGKYVKIDIMFPEIQQIAENSLNNNSVVALVEVLKSNNYFNINRYRYRYNNMYKYNEVKNKDVIQTDNFNKMMYKSKIKYISKNLKILYTGDIEKIAEDKIVENIKQQNNNRNIDILKSAHHGSNSSSTIQFLEQFNITAFVISCGKNNNFSHPSKIVLKRYEEIIKNTNNKKRKKQMQLLPEISRTDREGEIIYIN